MRHIIFKTVLELASFFLINKSGSTKLGKYIRFSKKEKILMKSEPIDSVSQLKMKRTKKGIAVLLYNNTFYVSSKNNKENLVFVLIL